jgi:hypothetical protein
VSKALWVPGADRTSRYFGSAYPNQFVFDHIDKLLWHSTETSKRWGCPGYGGGGNAPQITINPWPGFKKTFQHWGLNRAGRALGNPSSTPVSENKDFVLQVEVIGYSDPKLGRDAGCYLPELPDEGQEYLAEFAAFVTREWGIPDLLPPTWPLYKVSTWAAMDAAHMTSSEYDRHRGWLAHMHAPLPSTHGDAALPIVKIRTKTRAKVAGAPDAGPRTTLRPGDRGDDVTALQRLLNTAGATLTVDGSYGPATEAAVRTFQTSAGLTVDGIAGPRTQAALTATTSPEEDDMALTDKVTVRDMGQTETREVTVETVLARASWAYFETLNLKAGVADIQAKLATMAAAGSEGGLDPARAEEIYREELAKRLDELKFVDAGDTP